MGQGVLTRPYERVDDVLRCEQVPLDLIAREAGTPAYVYSAAAIRAHHQRLSQALSRVPHHIHYACKANGSLGLLVLLRSLGTRIDVVSGGELYRAQQAGYTAEEIIFGGVGKSPHELAEAIDAGVQLISVESESELRIIGELAADRARTVRVGIRVNPEIAVESFHEYIKTGQKGDKFGIPWDQALDVARLAAAMPNVVLVSIGMHIGSQLSQLAPYGHGIDRLETLVAAIRASGIGTLEHVDIGGGLFVPYADEHPADLEHYADIVVPAIRRLGLELIVEPGRYLVADSGVLLTRVLYRKRSGGRDILVTDAGMNDLLRPSHYDAYHRIEAVQGAGPATAARRRFDVVGPICESGDFLAIDREMEDVDAGALLCVYTTGAYGYSMASNYNARPRPVQVLVEGRRWGVITAREAYADLVRLEESTPQWRTI